MKDSIIQDMRFADYDIIDGSYPVERHHIFEGVADRKLSDRDGLWVSLSKEHHTAGKKPKAGTNCDAHSCKIFGTLLHMIGQLAWERDYLSERAALLSGISAGFISAEDLKKESREQFMKVYGKNYL